MRGPVTSKNTFFPPVTSSSKDHQADDADIRLRDVLSLHTFESANQSYRERSGRADRENSR